LGILIEQNETLSEDVSTKKQSEDCFRAKGRREGLVGLLLRLLVGGLVELGGDEHHALVLHAVLVGPFFGLEVALHGEHRALGEPVERCGVLVLAPCLDVDEGRHAVALFAVLLDAGDSQ